MTGAERGKKGKKRNGRIGSDCRGSGNITEGDVKKEWRERSEATREFGREWKTRNGPRRGTDWDGIGHGERWGRDEMDQDREGIVWNRSGREWERQSGSRNGMG